MFSRISADFLDWAVLAECAIGNIATLAAAAISRTFAEEWEIWSCVRERRTSHPEGTVVGFVRMPGRSRIGRHEFAELSWRASRLRHGLCLRRFRRPR